jgi:putative ABC transport system permease protein
VQSKLALIVGANKVGPRYFQTLGVRLLQGRAFDEDDRPGTPAVAIVNETLARHFWPHASPVGRTLMADRRAYHIIGVVPDAQYHTSLQPPPPFLYTDYWQHDTANSWSEDSRTLVRVVGNVGAMLPVLRKQIAGVDPNVPISEDRSLAEWLGSKFQSVRMATNFFICFGGLALFLSAIGLYGILAFTVSQRTREIGIRMALGAERSNVAGIVVRQGVRLALIGTAIGLSGAFASVRFLESFLYGVHAYDPVIFLLAPSVLVGVALLASYIPARRATKVDPMVALRYG